MATKQEALNFLKLNYKYEELDEGMIKAGFVFEDGRSQVVFALIADDFIHFSSPFASIEDVTPKQALEANSKQGFGMQLMADSIYVVKHVVPLEDLDASEIAIGFHLVAAVADELENELVGSNRM